MGRSARAAAATPETLTAVSLFSGCGGLDLGAERAGVRVVWATDRLTEAADALARLLPDTEFQLGDIRRMRAFPTADIVLGGYPCQPFSTGGRRAPAHDTRSALFMDFARAIAIIEPRYFVAENVVGLCRPRADGTRWIDDHLAVFKGLGRHGYNVTAAVINAADHGVAQRRRRVFIVGVRSDIGLRYNFPAPTHSAKPTRGQKKWESHGDALTGLSLDADGEYYRLDDDRDWPWYYMSRNRKADWAAPSFTVLANARHATLHPAGPRMEMQWADLTDGWKQGWAFTDQHEHIDGHPERPTLERPRRLSWRECSVLQSFPADFEPSGALTRKYEQIGNAVPPALAEAIVRPMLDGSALSATPDKRIAVGPPSSKRWGGRSASGAETPSR